MIAKLRICDGGTAIMRSYYKAANAEFSPVSARACRPCSGACWRVRCRLKSLMGVGRFQAAGFGNVADNVVQPRSYKGRTEGGDRGGQAGMPATPWGKSERRTFNIERPTSNKCPRHHSCRAAGAEAWAAGGAEASSGRSLRPFHLPPRKRSQKVTPKMGKLRTKKVQAVSGSSLR